MRGMDLDAVEAEPLGAPGRRGEVVADLLQAGGVERRGRVLAVDGGTAEGATLPAAGLAERRSAAASQGARSRPCGRRGRAACQRDRRVRAHSASTRASAASLASLFRPGSARDASLGRDRGRLDDQQRRARQRQVAEVDQVPVARRAFARRYWHIGAMTMRLASRSAPICKGSKKRLIGP